jgi:ABC-type phosphate/phosphonate transport system substrate-binding protein
MNTPVTRRDALTAMAAGIVALPAFAEEANKDTFTVIVMDPLAAPLSCPCVKGYAQRDYEKLSAVLAKALNKPVKTHFSESLTDALKKKSEGKADLVIGKESVVRADLKANKLDFLPIASLSGKDGKTTMTGLFVVASLDKAFTPSDLKAHKFIFGSTECDEKHSAALTVLKDAGINVGDKLETCASCSDGAVTVIEKFKAGEKTATVISSYAQPLLEGCGTIKKGDLRVVGETAEVPFIVAFMNEKLSLEVRETVQRTLSEVSKNKDLCVALETKLGFVEPPKKK